MPENEKEERKEIPEKSRRCLELPELERKFF